MLLNENIIIYGLYKFNFMTQANDKVQSCQDKTNQFGVSQELIMQSTEFDSFSGITKNSK